MRRAAGYAESGVPFKIRYSADLSLPVSQWPVLDETETQVLAEQDGYQSVDIGLPPVLKDLSRLFFILQID